MSLQERVERAKMLVEQRKMEKQKDEDDKEKNKEMERREVGKVRTVCSRDGWLQIYEI